MARGVFERGSGERRRGIDQVGRGRAKGGDIGGDDEGVG